MLSWQHPLQLRLNLHLQRPRIQLKPKQPSRLQAIRPLRQHLNLSMSHLRPQQLDTRGSGEVRPRFVVIEHIFFPHRLRR